jgi:hypothetical protein
VRAGRAVVVVASRAEPARIAGAHARAHAEEITLYREAVERALDACGIRVVTFLAEDVRSAAVATLRRSGPEVDATLKAFSHQVGTPWRVQEKHAALAAWLSLEAVRQSR